MSRHDDVAGPAAEKLAPADAERLLRRASHLDAARGDVVPVTRLREAASEAGIAPQAFDAALAEMRADGAPRSPVDRPPARRRRTWLVGVAAAALVAGGLATAGLRVGANAPPAVPTVEEGLLLRCLTPGEAAELVRPMLSDRVSTVTVHPQLAPRVLTIRTTPGQLARAKSLLAAREGAGACAAPAPPAR